MGAKSGGAKVGAAATGNGLMRKASDSERIGKPSSPPGGGKTGADATGGGRAIGGGTLEKLLRGFAGD